MRAIPPASAQPSSSRRPFDEHKHLTLSPCQRSGGTKFKSLTKPLKHVFFSAQTHTNGVSDGDTPVPPPRPLHTASRGASSSSVVGPAAAGGGGGGGGGPEMHYNNSIEKLGSLGASSQRGSLASIDEAGATGVWYSGKY